MNPGAERLIESHRLLLFGKTSPARDAQRIFIPFFTTKASGHGVGLALAHRVVTQHGEADTIHLWCRISFSLHYLMAREAHCVFYKDSLQSGNSSQQFFPLPIFPSRASARGFLSILLRVLLLLLAASVQTRGVGLCQTLQFRAQLAWRRNRVSHLLSR